MMMMMKMWNHLIRLDLLRLKRQKVENKFESLSTNGQRMHRPILNYYPPANGTSMKKESWTGFMDLKFNDRVLHWESLKSHLTHVAYISMENPMKLHQDSSN
ncbi:unnamed protein product [Nesidiocoris tenuis]|uniref:Uncharacterized protein n=1 Tax=Nesidiocoris tenuis TaxID=355587 RepID=A0A6H5GVE3_9HEMI|nr:unnamed protein product [Nesidiocoris tenuis]CAB0006899.1 unnamed protein product [Nesidiocoris tenuis]